MPVTPPDLLRFAKSLDCTNEAACRAAISRAYYCAYHAAAPIVSHLPSSKGYDLMGHIRHSEVKNRLNAWKIPASWDEASKQSGNIGEVKRAYRAALVARALADYDLGSTVNAAEVRLQIERVDPILKFCVRLESSLKAEAVA